MLIKVKQIEITFDDCKYDIDLQNKVEAAGIYSDIIAGFTITGNSVVFLVEVSPLDDGFEMEITDDNSGFSVTGSYVIDLILMQFPNAFIKTQSVGDGAYIEDNYDVIRKARDEYVVEMRTLVDYYIDSEVRIPLTDIEFVGGGAQIFKEDGTIVLLLDKYELTYAPASYNSDDGTINIIRSETVRSSFFEDQAEMDLNELLAEREHIDDFWAKLEVANIEYHKEKERRETQFMKDLIQLFQDETGDNTSMAEAVKGVSNDVQMHNILSTLHAIENDEPYEPVVVKLTPQQMAIEQMQTFMDSVKDEGQTRLLNSNLTLPLNSASYAEELETVVDEEISTEELESFTKGYRTTTMIEANVETISFDKFDDMANKYHIVGWDLSTPNTLSIKFIEGTTPSSTIQKFHEMMDGLDSGWVNTYLFNNLKEMEESSKFLAELRSIISDDTDVAQEFINRVKKHNIFVRESMAKMRSALLDMEADFDRVLKDEINLNIDWEHLTAFASKKERTEHRIKGVAIGNGSNGSERTVGEHVANLVLVSTGLVDGDFYIPLNLLTEELQSKYVIDYSYAYYIEDAPQYAFYEVQVNGHFLLIEKTDI